MSRAINTANPKYSKLTIGVCPDQWGVWFPADPEQMDPRRAWGGDGRGRLRGHRDRPRFQAAFNREVQEWINAVARDEHTGSTAWDGYAATAVVDAAVKSLEDASSPLIDVELIDRPALYA